MIETDNKLAYLFEQGILLEFSKSNEEKSSIYYTLNVPKENICRTEKLTDLHIKMFKNLKWGNVSQEFDKIEPFIKETNNEK